MEVPYPGRLVALRVHVSPEVAMTWRLMVELKPSCALSVMVELPEEPVWKLTPPLDEIVKPGVAPVATLNITETVWVPEPPSPVTMTVYVPGEPLHERVELSWPTDRPEGESEQVSTEEEGLAVSWIVEVSPPILLMLMVDVPVDP